MRAGDLTAPFPVVNMDTPAADAARLLARRDLPGLIVTDAEGRPLTVLSGTQVPRMAVPRYCEDDLALARVVDEPAAGLLVAELAGYPCRVPSRAASGARCGRARCHRAGDRRDNGPYRVPAGGGDQRRSPADGRGHAGRVAGPGARVVSGVAWVAVAVFARAYVLIATEKVDRGAAALGPAGRRTLSTRSSPARRGSTGTSSSCCRA